jgi:hypothetical protein
MAAAPFAVATRVGALLWIALARMKSRWNKVRRTCRVDPGSAGGAQMDNSFLEEQAARCRRLAERSDPFTKRRLLELAASYDGRLLGKPSRAARRLANLPTELPPASAIRLER